MTTIQGSAGHDTLIGFPGDDLLEGLAGNDWLEGRDGNDTLLGGAGRDTLIGGGGNDNLDGGEITDRLNYTDLNVVSYGNSPSGVIVNLQSGSASDGWGGTDTLSNLNFVVGSAHDDALTGSGTPNLFEQFMGNAGNDTIDGGWIDPVTQSNSNRVSYENAPNAVVVDLASGSASDGFGGTDTLININHVRGSAHNDVLLGSDSALTEQFEGREGNDTIDGRGGFDLVRYDNAPNGVYVNLATGEAFDGYGGTDTLLNIEGIRGSAFNDTLIGGHPNNGVGTTDGIEWFIGGAGNDLIDGGAGYDRVEYGTSTSGVTVTLGGDDPGSASDGFGGTDTLVGIEAVRGSQFDDLLIGSDSGSFESFEGAAGNDTLDGRGGVDRADYRSSLWGVQVNLGSGTAQDGWGGTDTLLNIENVRGSSWDDLLTGDAAANRLEGLAGNDRLEGGAGNDTLLGGAGRDTLIGGSGNDSLDGGEITDRIAYTDLNIVSYAGSTSGVTVNLQSGSASDGFGGTDTLSNLNFVDGSAHDDHLIGSSTPDLFEQFQGNAGNDTIDGGWIDPLTQNNSNRVSYANSPNAVVVDLASGSASDGFGGTDTLININHVRGSAHNDALLGSDSALTEQFEGMAGNDTIDGRGGDDLVRYDSALTGVHVNLGSGEAFDGYGTIDTLININGVRGSTFDDTLIGGHPSNGSGALDGFEWFIGGAGNDHIDGGAGYDRVDYTTSTTGVTVVLHDDAGDAGWAHDGFGGTDTLINIEAVRGSAFDDLLMGSHRPFESFEGRQGNDTIDGGGGIDRADYRGSVNGVVVNLYTGTAQDGWGGTDTLLNIENVRGSAWGDLLVGNTDANRLEGGGGHDTIYGWAGENTMEGGDGDDRMFGGADNDMLFGGQGNDALFGGYGHDHLMGDTGNDSLRGDRGNDKLTGGAGNDLLNGGEGIDWAFFNEGFEAVTVHLWRDRVIHDGHGGTDTIVGVENILGSHFDDYIAGNKHANRLEGIHGHDTLRGGSGDDTLVGGSGNDSLNGGHGFDTADYSAAWSGLTVKLWKQRAENDGDGGQDTLISIEHVIGSAFNDFIAGDQHANLLKGGAGDDTLRGGSGDDTLIGGEGQNVLDGGFGHDTLFLGQGANRVHVWTGGGQDTVHGFSAVQGDVLALGFDLNGSGITNATQALNAAVQIGTDVVLDLGGGHGLTLVGVSLDDLDASAFQIV